MINAGGPPIHGVYGHDSNVLHKYPVRILTATWVLSLETGVENYAA